MSRTQGNRTGDNRLITFVLVRLSDLSQLTALETLRLPLASTSASSDRSSRDTATTSLLTGT